MYKKFTFYVLLLSISIIGLSKCSQPLLESQIHFGVEAAKKDLWDEAIFRWKKAVISNPKSAAAHNNLAVAYEKKGLLEEAKKEYEAALKFSPTNKLIESNYQNFIKNYALTEKNEK